ncbi:MAG: hypothetical protein JWM57_13, partial [Phycisphaerales bacterium]|nr:hypothetical protein [Phycisphaerales bacterium]
MRSVQKKRPIGSRRNPKRIKSAIVLASVTTLISSTATDAEVYYYKEDSTVSTWLTVGNWTAASTGVTSTRFPGLDGASLISTRGTITDIANFGNLSLATVNINFNTAGGSLQLATINSTGTSGGLTVTNNSTGTDGILTLNGTVLNGANTILSVSGGQTLALSNATKKMGLRLGTTSSIVSLSNGSSLTVGSDISELTSGSALILSSDAASQMTISGTSNYTGATTINGGIMEFSKALSLYNANSSGTSWTASNITIGSGATLALNVGTGGFTATQVGTIASLGSATGGFKSGSKLGLDLASGTFAYTAVLADTNGGASAVGLAKSGAGALTLSAANTFTGVLAINGGILTTGTAGTLANGGVASSIGKSSSAAANLVLNGGTLQFSSNVALASTDRLLTLTESGGALDASGSGNNTITFAGNGTGSTNAIAFTGSGARILTLTGSNTSTNVFVPIIGDGLGGATSLTKSAAGAWELDGQNTYTGGTTVAAGTLTLGHATNTLADSGAVTVSGGTLALGVNSDTVGAVSLTGGTISGSGTLTGSLFDMQNGTVNAVLGGDGAALNKSTGSTVVLNGQNTYAGGTTVSAGTLTLGHATNTLADNGAVTVSGGTLALGVNSDTVGVVSLTGGTISGTGTLTGTSYDLQNGSVTAVLGGAGVALTKSMSGTVTLSGANTYTGNTIISGGTLQLGTAGTSTNTPLGTTAAGTTVSSTGSLDLAGFTLGAAEALTLNGAGISSAAGALANSSNATPATYSGLVTLGSSAAIGGTSSIVLSNGGTITGSGFVLTLLGAGNASSIASVIGTDTGSVTKSGTGTWTLSAQNTYTGGTTVSAGTLALGHATNTLADTGAVTVSGGTLALGVNSDTVGAVVLMGGTISGSGTLTGSSFDVQNGTVNAALGGVGVALSQSTNGGSVVLNGQNTYTGGTTVSAGTLTLGHATNTLADNGAVTVSGTGTLALGVNSDTVGVVALTGGTISGTGTLTGTSYDMQSGSVTAVVGGAGAVLTKSTSGTVTLAGASTYSGNTNLNEGTLRLGSNSIGSIGAITSGPIGKGTLTLSGGTTLSSSSATARSILNPITFAGDVVIGDATLNGTVTFFDTGTLTGARQLTIASNVQYTGVISDGGNQYGLTKLGAGTLTFNGDNPNTYTGTTVVSAGSLVLNKSIANAGNIIAGNLSIGSAGTVSLSNRADQIADTATVTVAGIFALNSNNETVAALVVNGGTVTTTGANLTTGSGGLAFTGGIANIGTASASKSILLGGNVVVNSSNAGASITSVGTTTLSKLDLNGLTRTFTVASGTGAAIAKELTVGAVITGTGVGIIKEGTGAIILSGANTYTGNTAINGGTVVASAARTPSSGTITSSSTGTGKVSINSSGVLAGTGGIGAVDVNSGGAITAGSGATRTTVNSSAAGDTVGMLATGNETWNAGGTGVFKFASAGTTAGTNFDTISMATLNLSALGANNKFSIVLTRSTSSSFSTPVIGTSYKLVTA